jgi:uncharacterized small protein (DUF1192 family)
MVDFDEEPKKQESKVVVGEDLATLSIDELEERIGILNAEILRIKEAIDAKRASLGVADSFFKS